MRCEDLFLGEKIGLPKGTFIVGSKLMAVCADCQKIIRMDKPIFGSLHLCVDKNISEFEKRINAQQKYIDSIRNAQIDSALINGLGNIFSKKA